MKFTLKTTGTLFLLLALMCQWNSVMWPLLQYEWKSDIQNLSFCSNQNLPQMNCKGKCHRNQQIESLLSSADSSAVQIGIPLSVFVEASLFVVNSAFELGTQSHPKSHFLNAPISFYLSQFLETSEPPPRKVFVI